MNEGERVASAGGEGERVASPSTRMGTSDLLAAVEEIKARGETAPRAALDPVGETMIRHWAEAIGDTDPRWQSPDAVAPPAMTQVWTMYGLDPYRPPMDPLHATMQLLDDAGYTSVLGTNCDQTYARLLRVGERPAITTRLESVVGPKHTGVGEGWFVTTTSTWWVGVEPVATMSFRVLKFRPGTARSTLDPAQTTRPMLGRDNEFFFEGTRAGELRIQSCAACGQLRHPPGPMCPSCHTTDRTYVVVSGRGRVHSWLMHHAPAVPGKKLPLPLVLVDLDEGVRMVGALEVSPGRVPQIGDRVEVWFDRIDDELTLAAWRLVGGQDSPSLVPREGDPTSNSVEGPVAGERTDTLPSWSIPITARLVVATAIATRDFQDVHHDHAAAVRRGSKDIFLNILASTGLVQRYIVEQVHERGWGPIRITSCELRLGAPAYPGDNLTMTGTIHQGDPDTVEVVGHLDPAGPTGGQAHVTARATFVREEVS